MMWAFGRGASLATLATLLLLLPTRGEEAVLDKAGGDDAAEAAATPGAVVTLGSSNFDDVVGRTERVLVEFYAPWCGHCKALEPEYERAATEMKAKGLKTVLAKVDATAETELAQRFGVSGYPTLVYFVSGREHGHYDGQRDASGIQAWLRKREEPLLTEIYQEEVESFLGSVPEGEFELVAHVKKKSARAKALEQAMEHLVDYEPSAITAAVVWLPKGADPKADASLFLWRPGFGEPDTQRLEYTGAWSGNNIRRWAKAGTFPTVATTYEPKKYAEPVMEEMGWDGLVAALIDDASQDEEEEPLRPQLLKQLVPLARAEPRWRFLLLDLGTEVESNLEFFRAKRGSEPMATVVMGKKAYVLEGADEITKPDAIKAFLAGVREKKVKPFYKSAPLPEHEVDVDEVTVLVGKSFERHALDPKKDVFVEFYTPWCGHCKKLQPVWAELAKKVRDSGWRDRGVVVAKMDWTKNECEQEVTGFPKLVLYPAVKAEKKWKQKKQFSKPRYLHNLVDFLFENAKNLEGVEDTEVVEKGKGKAKTMVDRDLENRKKAKKHEL
mmetsp:Transcript_106000/g.341939  ORF Transcript_106000/g.341939 Transcript_106000/m.341939 type:complete len:555 (+) Transcript_106000:182-1846(+)